MFWISFQISYHITSLEGFGLTSNLLSFFYMNLSQKNMVSIKLCFILYNQLLSFISSSLSTDLSAYRKSNSSSNGLVKCVENWRQAIDNNQHVGYILINLSKAFDCLPHGLLIAVEGFNHNIAMEFRLI